MMHPLRLRHFSTPKNSSRTEQKAILTARTRNIYELMQKAGFRNREILGVASELLGCVTQQLKDAGDVSAIYDTQNKQGVNDEI